MSRMLLDVKRVVLCTGKVYYDLVAKRTECNIQDVAIIRLEQLYPFPKQDLKDNIAKYSHVTDIVWAQEEPENQGAWWMIQHHIRKVLHENQQLNYVGRSIMASPAVGYPSLYTKQQNKLVIKALNL